MARINPSKQLTRMALIASVAVLTNGAAQAATEGAAGLPLTTLRNLGLSCESLVPNAQPESVRTESARVESEKESNRVNNTASAPGDEVIRQGFSELLRGYDLLLISLKEIDPTNEKQAQDFQADFEALTQKVERYRQEIQSSFDGWLAPELNQATMIKVLQSRAHLDQLFAEIRLFETRMRTTTLQAPAPHLAVAHRVYKVAEAKGETPLQVRFGDTITSEFLRSEDVGTKASAIMFIETLKAGNKKTDFEDGKKVRGYQLFTERVFVKNLKTPGLGEFVEKKFAEVRLEGGPRIFAVIDQNIFNFVLVSGNSDTSLVTRHLLAEDAFDVFQIENWQNKK